MVSARRTQPSSAPASIPPRASALIRRPTTGGAGDRDHAGQHHLLERGGGGDVDAARGVRPGGAFQQAAYLPELAADLVDHLEGGLAHRVHGEGSEKEGNDAAHEDADEHVGVADLEREVRLARGHRLHEGGDDRERGERGGADREALSNGGGGVAELVQGVGDRAGLFTESAHLRDSAGVVGDRSVGVDGHG